MREKKHSIHRSMTDTTSAVLLIAVIPFTIRMKTTIEKEAVSVSRSAPAPNRAQRMVEQNSRGGRG